MVDVSTAMAAFTAARASLVDALQMEYFCDDLDPPEAAFGWSIEAYEEYYKSGGKTMPVAFALPPPTAPAPPVESLSVADDGPDEALMAYLDENGYAQLKEAMATITWDECSALFNEGRPKLITRLGKLTPAISLGDRQKFATSFGKATKPAVQGGQPGGGRSQPPLYSQDAELIDTPGRPMSELQSDLKGYQEYIISAGIPPRKSGLFPPADEFLNLCVGLGLKPCTKALCKKCVDGGFSFDTAEGWVSGDGAVEHGIDLRWFITPGFEDKTLIAAVRFSEWAQIGRGVSGMSVHGGAVETCLDEATAELAKSKLFPFATTAKINFQIKKPLEPAVTYRVHCKVDKELAPQYAYEVSGAITSATDHTVVFASCTCTMMNPGANK